MHTARIVMESARVSQVEMQFSQCVSFPSWANITAGRIFLTADETSHHHQGWKNATTTGRGVIANNNYSVVLARGRSTSSRVLERSTKRPWPCPLC